MIIKFSYCKSPKNYVTKELVYTEDSEKTGSLKDETSVINPTILVAGISHLFDKYNYMEIPKLGRSYFITDIVSVRKGLVAVSGHCDVLSSAGDSVKNQYCIVSATSNGFNKRINNGSFKVYQNRYIINKFVFPYSFEAPGDYVLALAGS